MMMSLVLYMSRVIRIRRCLLGFHRADGGGGGDVLVQTLRVELAAALAAGSADLEGRERSLKEAEQRLQQQQVRRHAAPAAPATPATLLHSCIAAVKLRPFPNYVVE
jgi:hypothetical protein